MLAPQVERHARRGACRLAPAARPPCRPESAVCVGGVPTVRSPSPGPCRTSGTSAPGWSLTTSGCIGQTYFSAGRARRLTRARRPAESRHVGPVSPNARASDGHEGHAPPPDRRCDVSLGLMMSLSSLRRLGLRVLRPRPTAAASDRVRPGVRRAVSGLVELARAAPAARRARGRGPRAPRRISRRASEQHALRVDHAA